ncbi:hypothetical protein GJ496_010159 [Pomphorhynchus laevis]|nr:hypothetical protein GJ496_010159 [Pomphorhynchus laevis]
MSLSQKEISDQIYYQHQLEIQDKVMPTVNLCSKEIKSIILYDSEKGALARFISYSTSYIQSRLNSQQFRDAISIRYSIDTKDCKARCPRESVLDT